MKKILLSTTVALAAMSGAAFAEGGVLERVLMAVSASASMSTLNGVFANVSESYTGNIDGAITNTMDGISSASAQAGSVVALDQVTVDVGDLATTVLGTVNTGTTTLGVNQSVEEAISGTTSAVSNTIGQLGGSASTGALVLNVSSNVSSVTGTVTNTFGGTEGLNGSVGNVATTVLGAVNTGTITSGIGSTVQGVTSGILGN